MTDLNAVTVPAGEDVGAVINERAAEITLVRLVDARVIAGMRPGAKITVIVVAALAVMFGTWLRDRWGAPSWEAVAVSLILAAAFSAAATSLTPPLAQKEPEWARAAEVHQQSLASRVSPATMRAARDCTTVLAGRRWRGAWLYVPRCTDPGPAHFGVCQIAGVYPLNGGLLIIVGEHLTAGPAHITAAVLGHELRHVTGWRLPVSRLVAGYAMAGWSILGWSVPWPALLPAAFGLQAALVALSWLVETSCDLGSARTVGVEAMLDTLLHLSRVTGAARAAWPAWQRHAGTALTWLAGPPHPPLPLRRALVRRLGHRRNN